MCSQFFSFGESGRYGSSGFHVVFARMLTFKKAFPNMAWHLMGCWDDVGFFSLPVACPPDWRGLPCSMVTGFQQGVFQEENSNVQVYFTFPLVASVLMSHWQGPASVWAHQRGNTMMRDHLRPTKYPLTTFCPNDSRCSQIQNRLTP